MRRAADERARRAMSLTSVVCPVFDTDADMLRAAAESVLSQEGGEVELLLVDDGSRRAETLAALDALSADPRVRLLRNARNMGPAGTRNAGIRAARGERVGFLDADDLWPPGSLAARLAAPAEPGDLILGGFEELLPGDARADAHPLPLADGGRPLGGGWYAWDPVHAARGVIDTWRHLGGLLAPKAALERAGLFDEGLLYGEDWLLLVRLAAANRVIATNKPLYVLRRQRASMMTRRARLTRAFSRAQEVGFGDPALRAFRKPMRWALVRQYKGMAVNSLANGAPLNGLRCALLAYRLDPREVGPLMTFLRAALIRDPLRRRAAARRYSNAVVTPGLT